MKQRPVLSYCLVYLILCFTGCEQKANSIGNSTMKITAILEIEKSEILYQENPVCTLSIQNKSGSVLSMPGPHVIEIHTLNLQTGEQQVFKPKSYPTIGRIVRDKQIQPNGTYSESFNLNEKTGFLEPGQYEIAIVFLYGPDPKKIEVTPVKLTVRPNTIQNFSLLSEKGGSNPSVIGIGVNIAQDPPELVRSQMYLGTNGGIQNVMSLGKIDLHANPVGSVPANTRTAMGQWFAWIINPTLHTVYYDEKSNSVSAQKSKIALEDAVIVEPLTYIPAAAENTQPTGRLVAYEKAAGTDGTRLQVFSLTKKGAQMQQEIMLRGSSLKWIKNVTASGGRQTILYLQTQQDKLQLSSLSGSMETDFTPPQQIVQWHGQLLGAETTMAPDDTILGACLVQREIPDTIEAEPEEEFHKIVMIQWKISADGIYQETRQIPLEWNKDTSIETVQISINPHGIPVSLIKDDAGNWFVFDGSGNLAPVTLPFTKTKLPIRIAYPGGSPILVGAKSNYGLQIMQLDGSDLPVLPIP